MKKNTKRELMLSVLDVYEKKGASATERMLMDMSEEDVEVISLEAQRVSHSLAKIFNIVCRIYDLQRAERSEQLYG